MIAIKLCLTFALLTYVGIQLSKPTAKSPLGSEFWEITAGTAAMATLITLVVAIWQM